MSPLKQPRTAIMVTDEFIIGSVIYTDIDLVVPGLYVIPLVAGEEEPKQSLFFTEEDMQETFDSLGLTAPTTPLIVKELSGEEKEMGFREYFMSFQNDVIEAPDGLPQHAALHFEGEILTVAPMFVRNSATLEIIENGLVLDGTSGE